MQNIPKIVRAKLQRLTAESHPDADLLTAFAEQSLAGRERDHVVEHLARCGDCREVVSLALPPELELQPLKKTGANWFRWPVLRWAAVAAGVALIASIVTMQYRRQRPTELASNVMQAKPAITTPAQSSQPASQVTVPRTEVWKETMAAPRRQAVAVEPKPAPSVGTIFHGSANSPNRTGGPSAGAPNAFGRAIGGPIRGLNVAPSRSLAFAPASENPASAATAEKNPGPAQAHQAVAVAGASQMVEVQAETAPVTTHPVAQSQAQEQFVQTEPADQAPVPADQSEAVGKAKPALAQGAPSGMAPAPLLHPGPNPMKILAAPRWTISASGALQRSLDGGKTWLDVDVRADGSMSAKAARDDAPLSTKKQSTPSVTTVFRAVSVSSNAIEVWAGGSGGALYHTVDAGNHWARVVPSAVGVALAADIISIQFSDPRNGTVTTSNAEVWTTADDGQTWHKQR